MDAAVLAAAGFGGPALYLTLWRATARQARPQRVRVRLADHRPSRSVPSRKAHR